MPIVSAMGQALENTIRMASATDIASRQLVVKTFSRSKRCGSLRWGGVVFGSPRRRPAVFGHAVGLFVVACGVTQHLLRDRSEDALVEVVSRSMGQEADSRAARW